MKKFQCVVCGYIHQGEEAPMKCPVCGVPHENFTELSVEEGQTPSNLNANWDGETEEVGLYLAFGKKAEEEGYPEIAQTFFKAAIEEGWHAAEIAVIQGKVKSTRENLAWRIEAELAAEKGKAEAAEMARQDGNHAAAEFFMRASKDEGRHAAMFLGHLQRMSR